MNETNSFIGRIKAYQLEKRVVTQEELKTISRRFEEKNYQYLQNVGREINLKEVLCRCKETLQDGEKYILTPQDESSNNPAKIIPLEEVALMELFKTEDSYTNEVIVLLDNNERAKLKWNNHKNIKEIETIEILFENMQEKNNMEKEFEKG